jgi:hypothetical protein
MNPAFHAGVGGINPRYSTEQAKVSLQRGFTVVRNVDANT